MSNYQDYPTPEMMKYLNTVIISTVPRAPIKQAQPNPGNDVSTIDHVAETGRN